MSNDKQGTTVKVIKDFRDSSLTEINGKEFWKIIFTGRDDLPETLILTAQLLVANRNLTFTDLNKSRTKKAF